MNLKLKRTPGIYLVGFMAAGKTTIGRLLAHRLGWSFFDIDEEIEAQKGVHRRDFRYARRARVSPDRDRGHSRARALDRTRAARRAGAGRRRFRGAGELELLENNGITIWLDCPFETVQRRVAQASHRPLARDRKALAALYRSRGPRTRAPLTASPSKATSRGGGRRHPQTAAVFE